MLNKIIYLSSFRYSFHHPPLVLFLFLRFSFIYYFRYLLFSLSLTQIINIFYCLNYTSLLLHLVTTHLVSHPSLSSIIFNISMLIIDIFYCFISLLFHLIITHLLNMFYNNYVIKVLFCTLASSTSLVLNVAPIEAGQYLCRVFSFSY